MKTKKIICGGVALLVFGMVQAASYGQVNQGVTTPAAQYFGNRNAGAAMQGQPLAAPTRTYGPTRQPLQVAGGKPFETIQRQPTLSPYLALDAVPEGSTSLPNWHLFVQPQLQQRNSAEVQARELMRTRQQMRVARPGHIVPETPPAGAPISGSGTQFLNVGSYFPGVR